jgi:hypothetical protein
MSTKLKGGMAAAAASFLSTDFLAFLLGRLAAPEEPRRRKGSVEVSRTNDDTVSARADTEGMLESSATDSRSLMKNSTSGMNRPVPCKYCTAAAITC